MKRLFVVIPLFLLSFLFVFSSKSFAADCCTAPFSYSSADNSCCYGSYGCNYALNCTAEQKCDINSLTCIAKDAPTTTPVQNSCCPQGGTFATGSCWKDSVLWTVAACTANQYCDNNVCKDMGPTIADNSMCGHEGQACCSSPTQDCVTGLVCGATQAAGRAAGVPSMMCMNKYQNEQINGTTPATTGNPYDPFCIQGKPESGVNTALGCVDVSSPDKFVTVLLRIATGIGGGLALALILYGVFIVTTSAGSPDKLKAGSEIITSAVIGLVFILLSIFLINLIGINILGIPGLS